MFNVNLGFEEKTKLMKELESVLDLSVIKDNGALPMYYGEKEVMTALALVNDEIGMNTIKFHNQFLLCTDPQTAQVFALYHPAGNMISSYEVIGSTRFIPVNGFYIDTEEQLAAMLQQATNDYNFQLMQMHNNTCGKKPLLLVAHLYEDDYLAWSYNEKEYKHVYGYKEYRNNFIVDSDTHASDNYSITPPSDSFIHSLDLDLNESFWNYPMVWNTAWEPLPLRNEIPLKQLPQHASIYHNAICLINDFHSVDYGITNAVVNQLKQSVNRYEKLLTLQAPHQILKKEIDIIKDSMIRLTKQKMI